MKLAFIDFWPNFEEDNNYWYHLLDSAYDVEIDPNNRNGKATPDLMFLHTDSYRFLDRKNYVASSLSTEDVDKFGDNLTKICLLCRRKGISQPPIANRTSRSRWRFWRRKSWIPGIASKFLDCFHFNFFVVF